MHGIELTNSYEMCLIRLRRIRRKFNCSKDLTNEINSIDIDLIRTYLMKFYSLNQVKLNIFLRLIENKNRNVSQKQKK